MKAYAKEFMKLFEKNIIDVVEFIKSNYQIIVISSLGIFSSLIILGSVGAYEFGDIKTLQFILQIAVGFLLTAVLVFYVKYQVAKEEKAELLEELEEMRIKEKGANRFELFK